LDEGKSQRDCADLVNSEDVKIVSALQHNFEIGIINFAVLVYSLLCELIMIMAQKKAANLSFCNVYLLGQVLNGVTLRAIILISAQLVAVFVQQVDGTTYFMAFLLGGSLIVSQIRAIHLYLSSHKLDYNRLLPQIERNYQLSMSTYFLGLAVIYKKLSTKPSESAYGAYDAYVEERTRMMRFSGFGDENLKKRQKCAECWQRLKERLTCKMCRWGSPKFWQLIQNDIPLLMAIPVA